MHHYNIYKISGWSVCPSEATTDSRGQNQTIQLNHQKASKFLDSFKNSQKCNFLILQHKKLILRNIRNFHISTKSRLVFFFCEYSDFNSYTFTDIKNFFNLFFVTLQFCIIYFFLSKYVRRIIYLKHNRLLYLITKTK